MLFFTYNLCGGYSFCFNFKEKRDTALKDYFFCSLNIGLASGDVTIKNTKYETFKNPIFEYNVKDYGSINFPWNIKPIFNYNFGVF